MGGRSRNTERAMAGSRLKGHMMAGKFEVYKDNGGKYRFRLKASNGQVIASGQGYASKATCLQGI